VSLETGGVTGEAGARTGGFSSLGLGFAVPAFEAVAAGFSVAVAPDAGAAGFVAGGVALTGSGGAGGGAAAVTASTGGVAGVEDAV